ncbi:MAG: type IVB secretion system lipoprotein DotD [Legionellales bacterium]|nr:type IVB secretion system lipoprotein DotD [Legionellales bacterium]
MKKKLIMLSVFLMSLTACAGNIKHPPSNAASDDATIKLAEAAHSVSRAMMAMAVVEKVLTPPQKGNVLTIPNAAGLQARVSVDWTGPIEEITRKIAKASHYDLQILGQAPVIPILVGVRARDKSLSEILRNIDYQAGNKAVIRVYPKRKIIEIRYANLYS